jgi:ribose transport system permease protein
MATSVSQLSAPSTRSAWHRLTTGRDIGQYAPIWIATALLFVVSAILVPESTTVQSLGAMLPFWGVLAIIGAGQTLIIQQRGIDLAVPGMVTLAAMVLCNVVAENGANVVVAVLIVVLVGGFVGLVNGLIITRLHITPLITTLAVNALLVGAAFTYTGGNGTRPPGSIQSFSESSVLGVSTVAWLALVLVLVLGFVARRSVVGRRFVAVGTNTAAARAMNIRVDAYVVGAYVVGAVLFSVAAILLVGYVDNSTTTLGTPYLFQSVMAVVIGGTSVAGGRGSVVATAVAALFLAQLSQVVLTLGAQASVQLLVQALAMTVAVAGASVVKWARISCT